MSTDPVFGAFVAALQQNPEHPLEGLARLAALKDDVRVAAAALLAAHLRVGDTLGVPLAVDEDDVDQIQWPVEGLQIGPFRIVRELDQGGMATVYLAERTEPYRETVVLKVPHSRILNSELRKRFHRERQTLADLRHPAIVSLLGGGELEDGTPYAVMEFVRGSAIDEFCRQRELTIAQRVSLFARVGEAVSYVHAHGIVHRDLKPTNVLVQDDGTPKLLDFGIAKLFASPERDAVAQTAIGVRLMTRDYASPEQRSGSSDLTPASDIYSLGVMLYELVTGVRPSPAGPTRPENDAASSRSTVVISAAVPSGLDAILRRMLCSVPSDRYPCVDSLVNDLRAFLVSPIEAARAGDGRGTPADSIFGGEKSMLLSVTLVYAVLYGIAVLTELAYGLNDYGRLAAMLVPMAIAGGGICAPVPFWMVWRGIASRRLQTLLAAVTTHVALVIGVWLGLRAWLPTAALVDAEFQTYTAQAGVLKSLLQFVLMIVPCVLLPFHFVLSARRDLHAGRHRELAALLAEDARAVTPQGTLYVRVRWLVWYLAALAVWTIVGLAFLFNNLRPSPYMNLFIALVLLRVALWLGMGLSSLLWYALRLEDLKREALTATR